MIVEIFFCDTSFTSCTIIRFRKNDWKIQRSQLEVVSSVCSLRGYRENAVVFYVEALTVLN